MARQHGFGKAQHAFHRIKRNCGQMIGIVEPVFERSFQPEPVNNPVHRNRRALAACRIGGAIMGHQHRMQQAFEDIEKLAVAVTVDIGIAGIGADAANERGPKRDFQARKIGFGDVGGDETCERTAGQVFFRALGGICEERGIPCQLPDQIGIGVADHIVLRGEIMPDQPRRDIGLFRDAAGAGPVHPVAGDAGECGLDQAEAAGVFREALKGFAGHLIPPCVACGIVDLLPPAPLARNGQSDRVSLADGWRNRGAVSPNVARALPNPALLRAQSQSRSCGFRARRGGISFADALLSLGIRIILHSYNSNKNANFPPAVLPRRDGREVRGPMRGANPRVTQLGMKKMDALPAVEIRDLRKSFGPLEVLKGVSLTARPGDVVAVIGGSGSGKSTMLRCINMLETPSAGEISIQGEAYKMRPAREGGLEPADRQQVQRIRSQLGMVFQNFNLWPHRTVLENVIEVPIHVLGVPRDEAIARGREVLARVGLANKEDVYPAYTSGGQQQRAAIARVLAVNPLAMLFDEPTSALDPELVGEVLTVIRDLAQEKRTMILVTHEMAFARDVANHVIFLRDGRIEEEGPPEQIFGAPQSPHLQQFIRSVM